MGWTHDYRDVARNRNSAPRGLVPLHSAHHQQARYTALVTEPGIPHLLRRRARWFSARLRHTRG